MKSFVLSIFTVGLSLIVILGTSVEVKADEADAKRLLKAMSDYMAEQQAISFEYDTTLEVVTEDDTADELNISQIFSDGRSHR